MSDSEVTSQVDDQQATSNYFVDEAGDLTLSGKRGKVLVGTPGCSKYFMLGVAYVPDPRQVAQALSHLRSDLLADEYFRGVPSMQPEAGKTARYFHATDDLPEVRREVFRLLPQFGAKVQVVIRRKVALLQWSELLRARGSGLTDNDVYDDLVKRLFRNLLHKADANRIVFARRGKSSRREALEAAIAKAQAKFERKWAKPSDRPTDIVPEYSHASAGLQMIDYYLWALQRLYERGEDRFFQLLRPHYRLIIDLDDKRNKAYGEYYSDRNPLDASKIRAF